MYETIGASFAKRLQNEYALLTAIKDDGKISTMTVSWGGFGILWGKEVLFVFVRPERYTFDFCESAKKFTLSFFSKKMKDVLLFCGRNSGRDVDKIAHLGLKHYVKDGSVFFDDATLTLEVSKIYADDIDKNCFIDTSLLENYKNGGFHKMYICSLESVIKNNIEEI